MRRCVVSIAALVAFLSSPGAATAAWTASIEVFPERPRVGQVVTVQVRPFWLLTPLAPALLPPDAGLRVEVYSAKVEALTLRLARGAIDPYVWSRAFRFRQPGNWIVRLIANPSVRGVRVHVRARGSLDVWDRLDRPLQVPTIAGGSPCPTTPANAKRDLTAFGFAGPV